MIGLALRNCTSRINALQSTRMDILLCNDDGILAPGIEAMYDVLAVDHNVTVVAPALVQSATAHAITIRLPLICHKVHVGGKFYGTSVEGSPADCVKLAVHALLPKKPDLVVSGLNAGANVGIHVLYSGTVAAAAEGAMLGCPAIAVSLEYSSELNFDRAAVVARRVIDQIVAYGLSPGHLYNVNIPALKPGWPRGVRVGPQSTLGLDEKLEKRADPNGRDYYWLTGNFGDVSREADTDLKLLREGYVTVTPLHFDLTHVPRLRAMAEWNWDNVRMR